jgi:uncharacterized protein (TIGR03118 family)
MTEFLVNHTSIRAWIRSGLLLGTLAGSLPAANNYLVHNLVSDLPGVADHVDKNLVNPWGNGFSGTSPFWVANNGTGTSTLYDGTGTATALVVTIPAAGGAKTPGPVTGVLVNSASPSFNVAAGKPASFIFCTEDGTISGWNSSVNATVAQIMADNSATGAVYKGCTLGGTTAAPLLYAANFNSGKIDVWDGNMKAVATTGAFTNGSIPAGFAPFNIQNMAGKLYVSYAKQDSTKHDDVPGAGNGYVAVYDMAGNVLGSLFSTNLISQGVLNSPWGMAIAPATFGDAAGALLVSNFGDGKINAFNLNTGAFIATLNDTKGTPISIPGIWSLFFGNGGRGGDVGTVYFTAGIAGNGDPVEKHGLFGSIQAAPSFQTSAITNGASFTGTLAPNTWVTIKGAGLSATTRAWKSSDFSGTTLPTTLDGVGVKINGEAAAVSYISPSQINFLVPGDVAAGPVQIVTTNNGLTSATISATLQPIAPSFFILGTNATTKNQYIAATHANNSLGGPPSLITGVTTTPFKAGETIVLYGNGFGPTTPQAPVGATVSTALPLVAKPTVTIGTQPANVTFIGLVAPGLYQMNVVVPTGIVPSTAAANLDIPVSVSIGAAQTQSAFISVASP